MSKREEIVKEIGDHIIDSLNEEKDYFIEYDEGYLDNAHVSISFYYQYGNAGCDVEASVFWSSHSKYTIECLLYGGEGKKEKVYKSLSCIEEAVNTYVSDNLDVDCLLDCIEEDYRDFCSDEWNDHGFRDEADYLHWRYG